MDKKERASNKETRREFLKKAALGTISGSALLAGLGLSGKAAERFMSGIARRHSGDFFSRVRETTPTEADAETFTGILNTVTELIEGNVTFQRNASRMMDAVIGDVQEFETGQKADSLGMSSDKTNLLAAGYLGALSALRLSVPNREQIAGVLSDPSLVGRVMEPGFVDSLYNTANSAIDSDAEFAKNAGAAITQLARQGEGVHDCWIVINVYDDVPCWVVYTAAAVVITLCIVTLAVALC
jgi:hypothetical protein